MTKKELIKQIVLKAYSVGVKVDGDMFFALAFRSRTELIQISKSMQV